VLGVFLGLRGAVADWAGRQWVGDLAAGALFLFGLAAALAAVLARQRRSRLAELRRRFGPLARPGDGTSLAPRAGPPRPATPRAPTRRKQDDT
jgi:hypothetical protein